MGSAVTVGILDIRLVQTSWILVRPTPRAVDSFNVCMCIS
jgi:hypothetical protein